jgi:CspA family cold shock protein
LKGKISKYLSFRGYGFISVEGQEKDIFFHVSKYSQEELPVQDRMVEFDVEVTEKGKEAVNIKIIREGSDETVEPAEEPVVEVEEEAVEPAEEPVVEVEEEIPESEAAPEAPKAEENDLNKLAGVGPKYRALLESANITTCKEVSGYEPDVLLANLLAVNEKEQITKRPPTLTKVKEWIDLSAKVVE